MSDEGPFLVPQGPGIPTRESVKADLAAGVSLAGLFSALRSKLGRHPTRDELAEDAARHAREEARGQGLSLAMVTEAGEAARLAAMAHQGPLEP